MIVNTDAGLLRVEEYNDGVARGVMISLNDDIVAMVDVLARAPGEETGEARVLVYKEGSDEPNTMTTVNR